MTDSPFPGMDPYLEHHWRSVHHRLITYLGDKVLTAIELLSPTNKSEGDGNELYIRKQREYRLAKVNMVEIDLTRAGNRDLVFPLNCIPSSHRTTYLAWVHRSHSPTQIEVYPIPLDQPLPVIAIPLRADQSDAPLDLQAAVTACYLNGRYRDIDYSKPLRPALSTADATWWSNHRQSLGR